SQVLPPILGGVEKCTNKFPSRHLGLISAFDSAVADAAFAEIRQRVSQGVDLQRLRSIANSALSFSYSGKTASSCKPASCHPVKIAVAYDEAFHFYYRYNLQLLEEAGAELSYFSPINDHHLPIGTSGIIFGGGYPEIYAQKLQANQVLVQQIITCAEGGMPIYGECGGLIYLSQGIELSSSGQFHHFLGLLPLKIKLEEKLRALGHIEGELTADCILGKKGVPIKGHQFRYSGVVADDTDHENYKFRLIDHHGSRATEEGFSYKNVIGTYLHMHWGDTPQIAACFVDHCRRKENG
ncbi:MAG: cobyrinate a,c-diamide synthase, partial [Oligoflexia bacterium]|nr:cobyrinate a,c-diamide synthase [Oligoflexia bacterium]